MLICKVKDKIKVIKKKSLLNKIEKNMIGTIEKIEEWKGLDGWGDAEYDCYRITVIVGDERIIIEDEYTQGLFGKYELASI